MTYHKRKEMSFSKFKSYMTCAARAFAEETDLYERPFNEAFLIGNYVELLLLEPEKEADFIESNADHLFKKNGELYAKFNYISSMVANAKKYDIFMSRLQGKIQVEGYFKIGDDDWRCKVDVLGDGFITDLKTCKNMFIKEYDTYYRQYVKWYNKMKYHWQADIYRHAFGIDKYYLNAISKKEKAQVRTMEIPPGDTIKEVILPNMEKVKAWRQGEDLVWCGECDYCADFITNIEMEYESPFNKEGVECPF